VTTNTPVVFIIFKRPDTTERVFQAIRAARPTRLFVIADGGRNPEEWEKCRKARAVIDGVDWPCEVLKNYADHNMGCRARAPSGIDWVFEHVDRAIIVEDDCLPDPTFFPYCEELLERYADNERIMNISGDNLQHGNRGFDCQDSYYFSRIPHVWGWATWKRAWKYYDINITEWPKTRDSRLLYRLFSDPAVAHRWEYLFQQYYEGKIDSWDGQWAYLCFMRGGLDINPRSNLISNIGFGPEATHSKAPDDELARLPTQPLEFPLKHPTAIAVNIQADEYTHRQIYNVNRTWYIRLRNLFKFRFPSLYASARRIFQA
jgi:hypothetical protein